MIIALGKFINERDYMGLLIVNYTSMQQHTQHINIHTSGTTYQISNKNPYIYHIEQEIIEL